MSSGYKSLRYVPHKRETPAALTGQVTSQPEWLPLDPYTVTLGGTERPRPTILVITLSVL